MKIFGFFASLRLCEKYCSRKVAKPQRRKAIMERKA
jgi:hypothetical protein